MRIRKLLLVVLLSAACGGGKQAPTQPSNNTGSGPPAGGADPGPAPALCDDLECLESGGTGTCLALCASRGGKDADCEKECSPEARCPKVPCPSK